MEDKTLNDLKEIKKLLDKRIPRNILVALGATAVALICALARNNCVEAGDTNGANGLQNVGFLFCILSGAFTGISVGHISRRAKIKKTIKELSGKQR